MDQPTVRFDVSELEYAGNRLRCPGCLGWRTGLLCLEPDGRWRCASCAANPSRQTTGAVRRPHRRGPTASMLKSSRNLKSQKRPVAA